MPYIKQNDRSKFEPMLELAPDIKTAGELNYLFTELAINYVQQHGLSYQTIAEVMSSFHCAGLEFYRKLAAPYEDVKSADNGDVYKVLLDTSK